MAESSETQELSFYQIAGGAALTGGTEMGGEPGAANQHLARVGKSPVLYSTAQRWQPRGNERVPGPDAHRRVRQDLAGHGVHPGFVVLRDLRDRPDPQVRSGTLPPRKSKNWWSCDINSRAR